MGLPGLGQYIELQRLGQYMGLHGFGQYLLDCKDCDSIWDYKD